ncbi:MAG: FAD-dependent thymidylate synthase [Actinomycetia bacterium]|nr:FAD-dependent thymidylate synthase [Actinomycetes bacterium]
MSVILLYHTPDPERAIAAAARLCYAPVGAAELFDELDEAAIHRVLRTVITSGHHSTLEHASYTFALDGVSRAMTHQLVRHRLASYNQQSQRYVNFKDAPRFIVPPEVAADPGRNAAFRASCQASFDAYRTLVEAGMAAEDARYLLPNATETKITMTMNVRELLHFFSLRCCRRAQWEIRAVADEMLELARPTAPYLFLDAGPGCRRGPCPEGKMCCGDPYPRIKRDQESNNL